MATEPIPRWGAKALSRAESSRDMAVMAFERILESSAGGSAGTTQNRHGVGSTTTNRARPPALRRGMTPFEAD